MQTKKWQNKLRIILQNAVFLICAKRKVLRKSKRKKLGKAMDRDPVFRESARRVQMSRMYFLHPKKLVRRPSACAPKKAPYKICVNCIRGQHCA